MCEGKYNNSNSDVGEPPIQYMNSNCEASWDNAQLIRKFILPL